MDGKFGCGIGIITYLYNTLPLQPSAGQLLSSSRQYFSQIQGAFRMFPNEISYAGLVAQQMELPHYFIDFIQGNETLFITFEHAGVGPNIKNAGTKEPWGFKFIVQKRGFSLLGIKPKQSDWYRKNDLHQFFRSAEFASFVSGFKKVVLYGGSMGGYAALAFAEAIPGCTVISINPQSTLDKHKVPWETRFIIGQHQNWQADFSDGAIGAAFAEKTYVVYDPLHKLDRKHIERLDKKNLICLRVPVVGHQMPVWLGQMGILGTLVDRILADDLSEQDFHALARNRRKIPRYFIQMATRNTKKKALMRYCTTRAIALNPMDQEALLLLCQCLFDESRFAEVLVLTENILKEKAIRFTFNAYCRLGKPDEAINSLMRLTSTSKKIPLIDLFTAAKLALSINGIETAEQLLAKASEKYPNKNKVHQLTALINRAKANKPIL